MANRLAWLTPDTLPTETFCRQLSIPNDPLILAAVSGALYPLTKSYNWEEYGSVTPDEIASAMLDMFDAYVSQTTGDCEGNGMTCADVLACLGAAGVSLYEYPFVRKSPTTGLPQWSIDETTWWELETVTTTPVGETCLAATRAALVMGRFWQQTFVAAGELFFGALATANAFLQQVNQGLLGILYGSNAQLANAIIFTDFDFSTYMVQSDLTENQYDLLTCLLLEHATLQDDGTVTFNFGAVRDNLISTLGVNPGTALTLLFDYAGEAGLNQAGQVGITDVGDCSSCGAWFHDYDFTLASGPFAAGHIDSPAPGDFGVYTPGVGWEDTTASSGACRRRGVFLTLASNPATTITRVLVEYTYTAASGSLWGSFGTYAAQMSGGAVSIAGATYPTLPPVGGFDVSGSWEGDGFQFSLMACVGCAGSTGGTCTITRLRVEGVGTDPFE